MDNNGHAFEVHVGSGRLFSRLGQVNFSTQTIDWAPGGQYDTGGSNAVAIGNSSDDFVEVHVGSDRLFYHYGSAGLTVTPSARYDTGSSNAVALDNFHHVVEVHVGSGQLYYHVGALP
jgi:hypothetical protein